MKPRDAKRCDRCGSLVRWYFECQTATYCFDCSNELEEKGRGDDYYEARDRERGEEDPE